MNEDLQGHFFAAGKCYLPSVLFSFLALGGNTIRLLDCILLSQFLLLDKRAVEEK